MLKGEIREIMEVEEMMERIEDKEREKIVFENVK